MHRIFFLILLVSSASKIVAQDGCILSAEIAVTETEIQLFSDKYQIKRDFKKNYVLFYPDGEKHSFWYKIIVDSDCRFAFKLTSADSMTSSRYFLYKNPDIGSFCKEIKRKKIIPARSGDFFPEKNNSPTIFSSGKKKQETDFISPVTASKGEIYYLNIRHAEESGCGHYLSLIVSSEVVSFRATYPKCFEEDHPRPPSKEVDKITGNTEGIKEKPMEAYSVKSDTLSRSAEKKVTVKEERANSAFTEKIAEKKLPENTGAKANPVLSVESVSTSKEISPASVETSSVRKKITQVTVSGIVRDTATKKPLQAELKWTDEITGKEIIAQTNSNGEYAIVLDEKVIYKLTCTVVGYKEKTIKFIRQNLNSETLTQDFSMNTLKPGENFILKHIYFYAGTYAIKPESQPELDKLHSFLASHEKVKIEIQGHTNGEGKIQKKKEKSKTAKEKEEGWDFHGNEKKLSKYRAEAIKTYLQRKGITEDRIATAGMGGTKMLYPQPRNLKEREANRRVEVYILSSAADLASVLNAISE